MRAVTLKNPSDIEFGVEHYESATMVAVPISLIVPCDFGICPSLWDIGGGSIAPLLSEQLVVFQ